MESHLKIISFVLQKIDRCLDLQSNRLLKTCQRYYTIKAPTNYKFKYFFPSRTFFLGVFFCLFTFNKVLANRLKIGCKNLQQAPIKVTVSIYYPYLGTITIFFFLVLFAHTLNKTGRQVKYVFNICKWRVFSFVFYKTRHKGTFQNWFYFFFNAFPQSVIDFFCEKRDRRTWIKNF